MILRPNTIKLLKIKRRKPDASETELRIFRSYSSSKYCSIAAQKPWFPNPIFLLTRYLVKVYLFVHYHQISLVFQEYLSTLSDAIKTSALQVLCGDKWMMNCEFPTKWPVSPKAFPYYDAIKQIRCINFIKTTFSIQPARMFREKSLDRTMEMPGYS